MERLDAVRKRGPEAGEQNGREKERKTVGGNAFGIARRFVFAH